MLDFLSLKPEVFGLDINDRYIKIVKLNKKRGFLELTSINEVKLKPGIISGGIIQDEKSLSAIIKTACQTVKGRKLKTKYAAVSLPEEKSFLQVIQMPKMEENELKSAVFFEAENYIPLPLDQVYLDFKIIEPVVDHLNHSDILIAAMPKNIVDSYVSCLKKAGLVPSVLEVEAEAVARALIKDETSPSPVALLNIRENSTGLIVFSGHSIRFTCSIAVNSLQLSSPDFALISLISEIRKYLDFYKEHVSHEHLLKNSGGTKILLSGEGAGIKNLPQALSKELGIPVEVSNLWANPLLKKSANSFSKFYKEPLSFATAIGLAMRGADGKSDITF